jgi:CBS domain containing-hemolysin-like protein
MVSRSRLTMLEIGAPWEDVLRTVSGTSFSRLPVYRGTPDRIVGMLRVKDLVDRYVSVGPLPLDRLIRPVIRLPEHLSADKVLAELRERRSHSAIVVDGNGAAVGLVTVQDVLGELLNPQLLAAGPQGGVEAAS